VSDELEQILSEGFAPHPKKADSPEKRVEEALQRALDATTPEHAGAPWEVERERDDGPGIRIPADSCEE